MMNISDHSEAWSCMIARWHHWHHKRSHVPYFSLSVRPSSRSNFNPGPSPSDSTKRNLSDQSLWFWSAVFLWNYAATFTNSRWDCWILYYSLTDLIAHWSVLWLESGDKTENTGHNATMPFMVPSALGEAATASKPTTFLVESSFDLQKL